MQHLRDLVNGWGPTAPHPTGGITFEVALLASLMTTCLRTEAYMFRERGNYSDVLPLKAARRGVVGLRI